MKQPSTFIRSGIGAGEVTVESVSEQIALALGSMRFGSVEITVHDGRVVQIEKREKVRLESFGKSSENRPSEGGGSQSKSSRQTDRTTGGTS